MHDGDLAAQLLPEFHFEERHRIRGLEGRPETLRAVVNAFDDHSDAWLNALLLLREWPARALYRWFPNHGIGPGQPRFGLQSFTRLSDADTGMAFGLMGRFWRLNFGLQPIADAQGFMRAQPPGAAKLVLSFQWSPTAAGRMDLETVTRIQCTDSRARRHMAVYWTLIRPFSGLIRLRILKQIRRLSQAPQ